DGLRIRVGLYLTRMNTARTFVRSLRTAERQALERGRKSADAFTVRRSQILLASADGLGPAAIGRLVGCTAQAVRNAVRACRGGPHGRPGVRARGARVPEGQVPRPQGPGAGVGPQARRGPEGPAPPPAPGVRQADQPVDARAGRRGLPREGVDAPGAVDRGD